MRSIQDPTPIFSDDLIILRASSRIVSPVRRVSTTSRTRSDGGSDRREGSLTSAMRRRSASSMRMQPRRAYEMLSFQKER